MMSFGGNFRSHVALRKEQKSVGLRGEAIVGYSCSEFEILWRPMGIIGTSHGWWSVLSYQAGVLRVYGELWKPAPLRTGFAQKKANAIMLQALNVRKSMMCFIA